MFKFLFAKADARIAYLLRFSIGIWFFVDTVSMLVSGYVTEAYVSAKVNLSHYGFEWLTPLPGYGMYVLFILLILLSVFIILGRYTRWALALFLIGFGYVFLLDVAYTLNKFYLFFLLGALLLAIQPDYERAKKDESGKVPAWNILIFQALLGVIYFYSGLAKLNHDWIYHSEPLNTFFNNRSYLRAVGTNFPQVLAQLFSFGGLVFDLSIIWLLIYKVTRPYAQIAQCLFHILNFTILGIGSFSIATASLTLLLFPTEWLRNKLRMGSIIDDHSFEKRVTSGLLLAISILVIQVFVPHRHYLSGQNVNWTEKGHRFSWRLMSRTKSGSGSSFEVINPSTGEKWKINPRDYLTRRQFRKMSAETDLILSFAHYLKKEWHTRGYEDVQVYARVMTKLNHRKPQLLIDPNLDLAKVERTFVVDKISLPMNACPEHSELAESK
ncbi:MAG: HTTM domain-containing protein [Bacteroidota bacterium]